MAHDGLGDRITSLTLRTPCWLFLRETANHARCFAVRLRPGDLYSMVRVGEREGSSHAAKLCSSADPPA